MKKATKTAATQQQKRKYASAMIMTTKQFHAVLKHTLESRGASWT